MSLIETTILLADEVDPVKGYHVTGTDGALAVYERWQGHWHVIHLASGRPVMPPYKAELSVPEQAICFGRRYYKEAGDLGIDLRSEDFDKVLRILREAPIEVRAGFWERVL